MIPPLVAKVKLTKAIKSQVLEAESFQIRVRVRVRVGLNC